MIQVGEIEEIEASANKLRKVARLLSLIFLILFWCAVLITCVVLIAAIGSSAQLRTSDSMITVLPSCLKLVIESAVVLFMIWVARSVFRDISSGVSPFTQRQANRLKIAAVLQLLHAVFVAAVSPAFLQIMGIGESLLGASIGDLSLASPTRIIPISASDIILAIVLFCAALFVEYGSLLQQLSDDTV